MSLPTGESTFQASSASANSAGVSPSGSIVRSRFGSALLITVRARISSPLSSSTPSPGSTRATGTPAAIVAPSSRAESAIAKEIVPMPPRT